MKKRLKPRPFAFCIAVMCAYTVTVYSEPLQGGIGASAHWGSGWLDLFKSTSFHRGDRLKLRVGGTANTIVVRFLEEGADPDDPSGIDGGPIKVPIDRLVEIVLQEDHENVIQISIHGGPNPWGLFLMGGGNGPATLLGAERVAQ